MRISGKFDYDAPPAVVYQIFTDKDALINATPGLQRLDEVEPDRYEAVVETGFFGIRNTYHGFVTVTDREADRAYRLLIDVQASNTYARGNILFQFLPLGDGDRCRVTYDADVELGGVRMLSNLAWRLGDFFLRGMAETVSAKTKQQA